MVVVSLSCRLMLFYWLSNFGRYFWTR